MVSKRDDLLKLVKEKSKQGRLSCAKAQKLAKEAGLPLIEVGKAADKLGIKIVDCQLGCF